MLCTLFASFSLGPSPLIPNYSTSENQTSALVKKKKKKKRKKKKSELNIYIGENNSMTRCSSPISPISANGMSYSLSNTATTKV